MRQKVYAYILRERRVGPQLLVFSHVDVPAAGIQVPGGTVEPGEMFSTAVQREVSEETGLVDLEFAGELGSIKRDMRGLGLDEVHFRHYFLFYCQDYERETWIAYEETPSKGSIRPITFRFFWVELDAVPVLHGGLDEMLTALR
jgi:ADP-ribose pyrophosphatase YjhB (NUDIX family)